MFPHLAGDVSYDLMAVFELYTKLSARKGLYYRSCKLDYLFIRHRYNKGEVYHSCQ